MEWRQSCSRSWMGLSYQKRLERRRIPPVAMYPRHNLAKLKQLDPLAPDVMKAFWAFDRASVADTAVPVTHKELIVIAVALTTQYPYCIEIHSANARRATNATRMTDWRHNQCH